MKFFETSKYNSFKKSTYVTLRWIGIIGQLIAINFVYFFLNSEFNFILSNIIIFLGILSNLYLIFIYKKTQLSDRSAFIFLLIDMYLLFLWPLLFLLSKLSNKSLTDFDLGGFDVLKLVCCKSASLRASCRATIKALEFGR